MNTILTNFGNMYNPHVLQIPGDKEYPLRMWFFGWAASDCNEGFPGCDAIFLARGKDVDTWEIYKGDDSQGRAQWDATMTAKLWVPVLAAGEDKYYDQWHLGDPSVVLHEGKYYIAYSSTGFDKDGIMDGQPGDTDGDIYCVMGATSGDGIHWHKSAAPLLISSNDIGKKELWDKDPNYTGTFQRPSLMREGDRWRMWFDYWQPGGGMGMGLAECMGDPMDSANWKIINPLNQPLIKEWPNPNVIKYQGRYYSFADPTGYPGKEGWASRQLREAVSGDGIHWRVLDFIPPDPDTPACQIPEAFITNVNGQDRLYLFYACQIGGEPYNFRYDRIRYMWRLLK